MIDPENKLLDGLLDTVDPAKIVEIVCRHCPDWSHEEIKKRVLAALAPQDVEKVRPPDVGGDS